ncbi:FHA domain-containing protein [Phlyctema vagabunda]|uniref:FHA domain-containing protein n=1 Tax=Phlyctema vagabunda TaxID=108571 RepID=A0ABR4PE02_9HELO
MWILENDGDAFEGKKLWLRPGKKFLFGRTKVEGRQYAIVDKTISRKHLTVEVDPVGPDDCKDSSRRSRVILEDLATKIGTLVNDEQIRGTRCELRSEHNVIRMGRYEFLFRITWQPVALTFSFTGKQVKADPFTRLYQVLGPLDIKVLFDYERKSTTHVVAGKRNTSKGLQALINGKHIVTDTFWEAILQAANAQDVQSPSPLEIDFESTFPDALEYLPPRGKEPTDCSPEAYAPNGARQDMFDGYTYVFYEQSQFDTLLAPITEGRGKALLHLVVPNESTVKDFVRFVKDVANEKGDREFEDGSAGKGVVVVKFSPVEGPTQPWYENFCREVSLHLDHRLIEQNEFLDAILNVDASVLRKALTFEQSGVVPPPPSLATGAQIQTVQSCHPPAIVAPSQLKSNTDPSKGRPRRAIKRTFKGFDSDDEDIPDLNDMPESMNVTQVAAPIEPQSQGMFVSQDATPMDVNPEPSPTQSTSLKRKTPPLESEPEDIMEAMAPAAAARKRRRQAAEAARKEEGKPTPAPIAIKRPSIPAIKPKRPLKREELDVQQELLRRREKEKELAEAETQALQEQLEGMDIEQIRNLTIIEQIEVVRLAPLRRAYGEDSDRWDDKWNGRKNFKKFRRQGEGGSRITNRVIVPLEEVRKRDYGIGDEYWLEEDRQRTKRRKERYTQGVSQTEPQVPMRAKSRASGRILVEEEAVQNFLPPDASSATQEKETPAIAVRRNDHSKTPDKSSRNKRPASTTLTKAAPAKKLRQGLRKPDSDEDDDNESEDELKFRFRRKK